MSELSSPDQIARHVSKGKRKGDERDGTPGIVDSMVFMPRGDWPRGQGLELYLSVTWYGCFAGELEEKLAAVTAALKSRLPGFDDERSRLGIVTAGVVHEAAALRQKKLSVRIVDPDVDVSYAGIFGMDLEDDLIAQELARRAILFRPRL